MNQIVRPPGKSLFLQECVHPTFSVPYGNQAPEDEDMFIYM